MDEGISDDPEQLSYAVERFKADFAAGTRKDVWSEFIDPFQGAG